MIRFFSASLSFLFCSATAHGQPAQKFELFVSDGHMAFSEALSEVSFAEGLAVAGWFNFENLASFANTNLLGFGPLDQGPPAHNGRTHALYVRNNTVGFRGSLLNSDGQLESFVEQSTTEIPLNSWVHLAASFDGEDVSLFINGEQAGGGPAAGSLTGIGNRFYLAHLFDSGFRGAVRDVRVWNRGVTEAEYTDLVSGTLNGLEQGLVAHWRLSDGSGPVAYDSQSALELFLGMEKAEENPRQEPGWRFTDRYLVASEEAIDDVGIPGGDVKVGTLASWGVADFNNDGYQDFFYSGPESFDQEVPVPIRFFLNDRQGGFYQDSESVIEGEILEQLHPAGRTTVVADLNGDSLPDIYAADGGVDNPAFDGARNTLLLSDSVTGKLRDATGQITGFPCRSSAPAFSGQSPCDAIDNNDLVYPDTSVVEAYSPKNYTHSTTWGDIDNDGDIDIYVGSIGKSLQRKNPFFLINDGTGNFRVDWQRVPEEAWITVVERSKTTSLLRDFDGDGNLDLFLGSLGWSGFEFGRDDSMNYIVWGDGTGDYKGKVNLEIPPVPGFRQIPTTPVAADIDSDGDLDIIVSRTSFFYEGRYLQVFENIGNREFIDVTNTSFPAQDTEIGRASCRERV